MNGWQPMGTAPKGEMIDIASVYPSGRYVRFTDCYWREKGWWAEGWTSANFPPEEGRVINFPDYWMPIPKSPISE